MGAYWFIPVTGYFMVWGLFRKKIRKIKTKKVVYPDSFTWFFIWNNVGVGTALFYSFPFF